MDTGPATSQGFRILNNVLARIEANDCGADEALMLDGNGYVAEATVDSFFIVTDHALMTPPTATNLKGVARETMIALAASLGIKVEEKSFTLFGTAPMALPGRVDRRAAGCRATRGRAIHPPRT